MAWKLRWPLVREDKAQAGLTINEKAGTPLTVDAADGFIPLGGQISSGGLSAVPAAYCAINLISEQLAILSRSVVGLDNAPRLNHPTTILLRFPSRMVDPIQFWLIMFRALAASGNSYCWIRRHFMTKQPIELVPAACERAEWVGSRASPYQRYTLRLMGAEGTAGFVFNRRIVANSNDVLTFHGPGYNGLWSPSPVQYAAENTLRAMSQVVERHRTLLVEGGELDKVLTVDPNATVSDEQFIKARAELAESFDEMRKAGKIPILPPGITLERIQVLSASDMQLIELLKWGVEDVARVWGLSPVRLGHYHEGMRSSTFEHQATDFERYTLSAKAIASDSQMTRKLLSVDDVMNDLQVKSNTDDVALGSLSERADIADKMVSKGGQWTVNEGRDLTGKPPRKDGDRLYQPKGAPRQDPPPSGSGDDPDNE